MFGTGRLEFKLIYEIAKQKQIKKFTLSSRVSIKIEWLCLTDLTDQGHVTIAYIRIRT